MHTLQQLAHTRPQACSRPAALQVLLLLSAAAATALAQHEVAAASIPDLGPPGKPLILMWGDSITAFGFVSGQDAAADRRRFPPEYRGWALRLNDTLHSSADVLNLAAGGSSTKGLVQHLRRTLRQLKQPRLRDVVLATIAFGANDAVLPSRPSWHVPLANFTANLRQAVSELRQAGISNILLLTPPPVGVRHPVNPDRMNNLTAVYASAVRQLGSTLAVPTADIFSALTAVSGWQSVVMQPDALHLSNAGNAVVHDTVWAAMQRHFPLLLSLARHDGRGA